MNDPFEQLSELEIAPPPPAFDRQLHARLNRALTFQHLLDWIVGALPWALLGFAQSLAGFAVYTFAGRRGRDGGPEKKPPAM